jgi:hypothetical protein
MKKLRLSVDSLRVDCFEVLSGEIAVNGTVVGQDDFSAPTECCLVTRHYAVTCGDGSCPSGVPCKICPA